MNCIFILLCLLQIVYSNEDQNKHSKSAKDLQIQNNRMPKGYCWRIKFYIPRKLLSGTSNYITVQLINDETRVFSNRLSCADKCKRGSQPSFDFSTPQIDPVKGLKLNETKKDFWNGLLSGWTLKRIDLMNLNTSANYRCTLDNPDADEKGCKLNPTEHVKKPNIPYNPNSSTSNIITITTENDQIDSGENTSALVLDTAHTSASAHKKLNKKAQRKIVILCSVLIPTIVLLCMLCIIVTRRRCKKSGSNLTSEEMTEKSTTKTCLPEEMESQPSNTLKQQATKILPQNDAHSIRSDPCMMENKLHSIDAYSVAKGEDNIYAVAEDIFMAEKDIYSDVNDIYSNENGSGTVHSDLCFTENEGYYVNSAANDLCSGKNEMTYTDRESYQK